MKLTRINVIIDLVQNFKKSFARNCGGNQQGPNQCLCQGPLASLIRPRPRIRFSNVATLSSLVTYSG